jgi:hypothetical protein
MNADNVAQRVLARVEWEMPGLKPRRVERNSRRRFNHETREHLCRSAIFNLQSEIKRSVEPRRNANDAENFSLSALGRGPG